jgi:hypothetical protein
MTQPSQQEMKAIFGQITDTFYRPFWEAYQDRQSIKKFKGDLPMLTRRWCVYYVAARRVWVILDYRPGYFSPASWEAKVVGQDDTPGVASLDDGDSIADLIGLNDIADAVPFPLEPIPLQLSPAYLERVRAWAVDWATKLADVHMARTNPSFDEAKERMMRAYEKLFELEHALRTFIDAPLRQHFGIPKWLLKAYSDRNYQDTIKMRKQEARHAWLDEVDNSETRFLDFDHIRQLIHANQSIFIPLVPDVSTLKRLLEDLKDLRNRIGHVNTLSGDDYSDFLRLTNRVLATIQPKPTPGGLP